MTSIADFVVYDSIGRVSLLVEAKLRAGASRHWAAQMRKNFLSRGYIPGSPFFMLVLPDRMYLWVDHAETDSSADPTFEFDANAFLGPYLERAGITPANLGPHTFELVVFFWLNELTWPSPQLELPPDQMKLLQESGLLEAIRGGTIASEVPV